jgi:CubicO group peptidase (beta-lactamase class C family)
MLRCVIRRIFRRTSFVLAGLALSSIVGCGSDPQGSATNGSPTNGSTTSGPAWPDPTWSTVAPESQGMDGQLLEQARTYAFEDGRNTQSIVVVRGGKIVAEWYAPGSDADSWATSWSVAKSFTSALIGIAIQEGLIENVDVPMSRYLPDWAGTDKEKILLRDVLQMASGLAWNEDYNPADVQTSDVIQLVLDGGHELEFTAGKPVVAAPGMTFNYSSGSTMLLSAVLQQATGMSALDYARAKLFPRLGIDRLDWWQSTEGHTLTFCCLDMTSRDFARFGLLYARGGRWRDGQLLSPEWVRASVASSPARPGYGYLWWLLGITDQEGSPEAVITTPSTLPPDTFAAIGVDDQLIYVVPHLDLVVVRNGTYVKDTGPAVADPNLLAHLPPSGVVPGKGTLAPKDWDFGAFLKLVIAAVRQ